MYRRIILLLVCPLLLAALAGCGDDRARASSDSNSQKKKVEVTRVQKGAMVRSVMVTGTLAPQEEVTLGFKVTGRVGDLYVDLGSHVHRGEALARLEPTDFDLRVQQAQAALEQARARLGLAPGQGS